MKYTKIKRTDWYGYKTIEDEYVGLWVQHSTRSIGCSIDYKNKPIYHISRYSSIIKLDL